MSDKMYFECVREKYGHSAYVDDVGFFTYSKHNGFVIEEFYLKKEFRHSFKIQKMYLQKMIEIAKLFNFNKITVSVYLKAKNNLQESTLFFLLRNDFKLVSTTQSHIWLEKSF